MGSKHGIFFWHSVLYICSTYWWVLSQKSCKKCDFVTHYMDGPNLIVHSAKYIQGFTYVAYGRGRVAEDNKGWTIMIIDQGPNVWASIGQRPLGYNVFVRMSVALKKKHIFFFRKNSQTVEVNSALQSISQIFCKTSLNKIFAKSEKEIEQVFARMSVALVQQFHKKYFRESRKGSWASIGQRPLCKQKILSK